MPDGTISATGSTRRPELPDYRRRRRSRGGAGFHFGNKTSVPANRQEFGNEQVCVSVTACKASGHPSCLPAGAAKPACFAVACTGADFVSGNSSGRVVFISRGIGQPATRIFTFRCWAIACSGAGPIERNKSLIEHHRRKSPDSHQAHLSKTRAAAGVAFASTSGWSKRRKSNPYPGPFEPPVITPNSPRKAGGNLGRKSPVRRLARA